MPGRGVFAAKPDSIRLIQQVLLPLATTPTALTGAPISSSSDSLVPTAVSSVGCFSFDSDFAALHLSCITPKATNIGTWPPTLSSRSPAANATRTASPFYDALSDHHDRRNLSASLLAPLAASRRQPTPPQGKPPSPRRSLEALETLICIDTRLKDATQTLHDSHRRRPDHFNRRRTPTSSPSPSNQPFSFAPLREAVSAALTASQFPRLHTREETISRYSRPP